ncbi:MAG: type II toxin-antitoxin system prevent-host-death family antitoxin, partial [Acidobacteria bacterium]|nr:type II toxin-antitoxin system prevent-host-death family antitoxin [Acidobacteriota bacterium]
KELKNRLGKYLRLVREGETVEITDRGRPVGCILPAATPEDRARAEMLAALVSKGGFRVGAGKLHRRPRPTVLKPGKSVADMVAEERR